MNTNTQPRALIVAGIILAVALPVLILPALTSNGTSYPPPACAPTDCETTEDIYLTIMRLNLEGGEWVENDTYAGTPDDELIRQGLALCSQLPDGPDTTERSMQIAELATYSNIDMNLLVGADVLCGNR